MSWFGSSPATPTAPAAPTTPPKPITPGDDNYRLALAKMLMQSGTEPTETKKAGGFNVPTTPLETMSKMAQSALGAYMMKGG